jgi:hypothetical protein
MIYGTDRDSDGNPVGRSIDDLKNKFCGYDVPSLVGKPKIWIIQACQGGQCQEDFGSKTEQEEPSKGIIIIYYNIYLLLYISKHYIFQLFHTQKISREPARKYNFTSYGC